MQVNIEETGALTRKMTITMPGGDITQMFSARFEQLAADPKVKLDGFSEGRPKPVDVIKQKFGPRVTQEVTQQALQLGMGKAFQENKISPAGQPKVEGQPVATEGQDLNFVVLFEIFPTISPKAFEGVELTLENAEPTDKMVDDALDNVFQSTRQFEPKEGAAATGDRLTIDAVGILDGEQEPFEGGKLEGQKVVLGSGMLIEGFEEGMVGMKVGDNKALDLTFPKDYFMNTLANKKASFDVTVTAVEASTQKKPDDAFAQQFDAENLDELKGRIRTRLTEDLSRASQQRLKRTLFDVLDRENGFEVPTNLIDAEFQAIWQAQMTDLQRRGLPMTVLGENEDEVRAEYRELAARRVRLGLLLAKIGEENKIKVEENEIDAEIKRVAEDMGGQGDQVRTYYQDPKHRQELVGPLFEQKVVAWIIEKAKVTEKTVDAEDLMSELG